MHFDEKFFVLVATITFIVLTFKPVKKALLAMIDGRIAKIKSDLETAEKLKNEAQKLFDESKARLEAVEKQAIEILNHAKNEANMLVENTNRKLAADVEIRKKLALQKIQSFEDNAVNELKKNISLITINAAANAIEESGDADNLKKLFNSSLDKITKTVH
jgi:F-type H+-transporting ATPase subunit b